MCVESEVHVRYADFHRTFFLYKYCFMCGERRMHYFCAYTSLTLYIWTLVSVCSLSSIVQSRLRGLWLHAGKLSMWRAKELELIGLNVWCLISEPIITIWLYISFIKDLSAFICRNMFIGISCLSTPTLFSCLKLLIRL